MVAYLTLAVLPASAPPATAQTSGAAPGVGPDLTWGISRAEMDRTVTMMREAGVRWVRMNVSWSGVERDGKGQYNTGYLADIDYAVAKVRDAGIEVLMPVADGVPYWASADPSRYSDSSGDHWDKMWHPRNPQDYADYFRFVVNRYKGLGVRTFEVWNEPNTEWYWPSGPSASAYVSLLRPAYAAIKQADPAAIVVLGGLSGNDYTYLQQVYNAGGRPYFDVVAVHPYTGDVDPTWCWNQAGTTRKAKDAFCGIEEVRNTMVANGDSAKTMSLTEFGWSTTTSEYGVSETLQASYFTKAFSKLQSYPYVKTAFWYNFRNTYWLEDDPSDWEANAGLLRTNFSAKPAYGSFRSYALSTTTAPPTAPLAPTNLTATAVSSSRINLAWTGSTGASSYTVQRSRDNASWTTVGTVAAPTTSFASTGLQRNTTYYYRVRASNSSGSSPYSRVVSARTARR